MSAPRRPFIPTATHLKFLAGLTLARQRKGLTQEQLAELIGLALDLVAATESGTVPLAFHDARRWFEALDIPHTHYIASIYPDMQNKPFIYAAPLPAPTSTPPISMNPDNLNTVPNDPDLVPQKLNPDASPAEFSPWPAYRTFLDGLIQARIERGFTLAQFAHRIGLGPVVAQAFETTGMLDFPDIRRWCEALNVPFQQFLDMYHAEMEQVRQAEAAEVESTPESPEPTPDVHAADVPTIQVLYFAPNSSPEVKSIPNTLDAMQELVQGLISPFFTGIPGTIGVANDEGIVHDMGFNRAIPATGAQIFGPFFVAGDSPDFRSLTPLELETTLDALTPELSQSEFTAIMLTHDEGEGWVRNWD